MSVIMKCLTLMLFSLFIISNSWIIHESSPQDNLKLRSETIPYLLENPKRVQFKVIVLPTTVQQKTPRPDFILESYFNKTYDVAVGSSGAASFNGAFLGVDNTNFEVVENGDYFQSASFIYSREESIYCNNTVTHNMAKIDLEVTPGSGTMGVTGMRIDDEMYNRSVSGPVETFSDAEFKLAVVHHETYTLSSDKFYVEIMDINKENLAECTIDTSPKNEASGQCMKLSTFRVTCPANSLISNKKLKYGVKDVNREGHEDKESIELLLNITNAKHRPKTPKPNKAVVTNNDVLNYTFVVQSDLRNRSHEKIGIFYTKITPNFQKSIPRITISQHAVFSGQFEVERLKLIFREPNGAYWNVDCDSTYYNAWDMYHPRPLSLSYGRLPITVTDNGVKLDHEMSEKDFCGVKTRSLILGNHFPTSEMNLDADNTWIGVSGIKVNDKIYSTSVRDRVEAPSDAKFELVVIHHNTATVNKDVYAVDLVLTDGKKTKGANCTVGELKEHVDSGVCFKISTLVIKCPKKIFKKKFVPNVELIYGVKGNNKTKLLLKLKNNAVTSTFGAIVSCVVITVLQYL